MLVAASFENLTVTIHFLLRLASQASDLTFFVSDLSQANVRPARRPATIAKWINAHLYPHRKQVLIGNKYWSLASVLVHIFRLAYRSA